MQTIDLETARRANNELLRQQHEIISKEDLKQFRKRNDSAGLIRISVHLGTILATGYLLYLSLGTP